MSDAAAGDVPVPENIHASKRDTLVADFPRDLGKGISGFDAWVAIAPSGAVDRIAAQAATAEREAIAANLEAEAEIGAWSWQAKDALRSFARRLIEMGDADLLDGAESDGKPDA